MKIKNEEFLYLFLSPFSSILFIVAHNKKELELLHKSVLIVLALSLMFTVIVFWIVSLIFKNKKKSGIITFSIVMSFFSYGHFCYLFIENNFLERIEFLKGNEVCFVIYVLILFFWIFFIVKTNKNLSILFGFLNVLMIFLFTSSLLNIFFYKIKNFIIFYRDDSFVEVGRNYGNDSMALKEQRDIYYIILDSYARKDILESLFDFDNSDFVGVLKENGFYVAEKSRSNYPHTFLSLSSSLNMKYINYLTEVLGKDSNDPKVPFEMIENNDVASILKDNGYKFINFDSGWEATSNNGKADYNIDCGNVDEFLMILTQTTALQVLENRFHFFKNDARGRVLCTFERLKEIHQIMGPKFIFAHIMVPHSPYLFDAKGDSVPKAKLEMVDDVFKQKENYLGQLIFVNKKMEDVISVILKKSKVSPIIIIQGDHGTASILGHPFGWENPPRDYVGVKERMGILNAYYLPESESGILYESITPVNSFRLILNLYFGFDYELLADKNYYVDHKHFYNFLDVTEKLSSISFDENF